MPSRGPYSAGKGFDTDARNRTRSSPQSSSMAVRSADGGRVMSARRCERSENDRPREDTHLSGACEMSRHEVWCTEKIATPNENSPCDLICHRPLSLLTRRALYECQSAGECGPDGRQLRLVVPGEDVARVRSDVRHRLIGHLGRCRERRLRQLLRLGCFFANGGG